MRTSEEITKVNMPKLMSIPSVIASGLFLLCPAIEEDKTIGNSGQMHGARIVTSPDIKANPSSKPISLFYTIFTFANVF